MSRSRHDGMTALRVMQLPRARLAFVAIRIGIGLLFVVAALGKIRNTAAFAEDVAKYQILPALLLPAFSVGLPVLELGAGALLTLGIRVRAAAWVVVSMLGVFALALGQALVRHLDLSCGCFGESEPASWWTVARDVALILVSVPLLIRWDPTAPACAVPRQGRGKRFMPVSGPALPPSPGV